MPRSPGSAPETSAAVNEQLCFALNAASRAVGATYRAELSDLGLTYPQYLALLALWSRGPQSVSELGNALRLDSGTLSPLLRRLESAGLVVRTRADSDERRVQIELTEAGRDLEGPAARARAAVEAATGLEHAEFVDLRDRLLDLAETLTKRPAR